MTEHISQENWKQSTSYLFNEAQEIYTFQIYDYVFITNVVEAREIDELSTKCWC